MNVRDLYALGVNGGALLGQRAAALAVLKIRNESGKKRTFLALGGSVTRRRDLEMTLCHPSFPLTIDLRDARMGLSDERLEV
jgi:hypothetical protein